ncbi:cytochrome P450 CYP72A219-like [Apium graveolens]|uniref:cytochrome P450 CYP72A219-like n=1 Tax=Apium graveolens TaxID=4045 RepID=UPI003D7A1773
MWPAIFCMQNCRISMLSDCISALKMDAKEISFLFSIAISVVIVIFVTVTIKVINKVWLKPKKLEKYLKAQGFNGNPYRILLGDMGDYVRVTKAEQPKQISLSSGDVSQHALPYIHYIVEKYGKTNSYMWWGPEPRLNILDPELIKEIMSKSNVFRKPYPNPIGEIITGGLLTAEDEKWTRHRKLISPAFHVDRLKNMLPAMHLSFQDMLKKWNVLVSATGSAEVDVWPYLEDMSGDVISRTAFGSNHEEGRKIFLLQKEQAHLAIHLAWVSFIPGWRYIPTKACRRMNQVCTELQVSIKSIIGKRELEKQKGEANNDDDLLGILTESNSKEIKEQGIGMSIQEVIDECKLFYFAGSETTSNLLVWTMVLLSVHTEWQISAREEVLKAFGREKPDYDGISHLKKITMILLEVLRLYPPAAMLIRGIPNEAQLGNTNFPAGIGFVLPILLLHYDTDLWGEDAHKFKPERFSHGIFSATKGRLSYMPFGGGPRICIGQNFAMVEAKMALAMILQEFSFELSPSYAHSPFQIITLQPQHGAKIILQKL